MMTDIILAGNYKDFVVRYNSSFDNWSANVDGATIEAKTWPSLELKIKNAVKKEFERVKVLSKERWGQDYKISYVTSHIHNTNDVWVVTDKKRHKERASDVLMYTEENLEKLKQIHTLELEINEIRHKKAEVFKSLETYKIKD